MNGLYIFLFLAAVVAIISLIIYIKRKIWDEPQDEIKKLQRELNSQKNKILETESKLKNEFQKELDFYKERILQEEQQCQNQKYKYEEKISEINKNKDFEIEKCKRQLKETEQNFFSNLKAFPYMAGLVADYETYGLELLAQRLDWGHSQERWKKVKSIREIRRDAKAMVEKNKEAQYQLAYLLELFPNLKDVIEYDYNQLPIIDVDSVSEYDSVRDYLSKEEYDILSGTERNQLALDRYRNSHNKTKWQVGRDYELYVGYKYSQWGFHIDYFGSYMGLEDLGRDLIAKNRNEILIIQCKYWSSLKQIHEKHITQLYGTMISYCIENNINKDIVKGVLVTNIVLSDMAKRMADYLGIEYRENFQLGSYPCIKCNIGRGDFGEITKIYHLPFDQKYDETKIDKPGEFYAMTVEEAENAGFRRAFKWFGLS